MLGHLALAVVTALSFAPAVTLLAQPTRPKAQVDARVDSGSAKAGADVRASLDVTLPNDVHVQSDKPRDASLIPTVVTVDVPTGVTVAGIDYPAPTDLAQAGQKQPLAVFGPTFTINVRLTLATDVPAGNLVVPVRLRYQACDAKACYPPTRADAQWTLQVTR